MKQHDTWHDFAKKIEIDIEAYYSLPISLWLLLLAAWPFVFFTYISIALVACGLAVRTSKAVASYCINSFICLHV